ncbi:unnamed protein product, partial [Laminaria digitata]
CATSTVLQYVHCSSCYCAAIQSHPKGLRVVPPDVAVCVHHAPSSTVSCLYRSSVPTHHAYLGMRPIRKRIPGRLGLSSLKSYEAVRLMCRKYPTLRIIVRNSKELVSPKPD